MPKLEEFIVPRVFALMNDQALGSKISFKGPKILAKLFFAGKKAWRREIVAKFASGTTMLIDPWLEDIARV